MPDGPIKKGRWGKSAASRMGRASNPSKAEAPPMRMATGRPIERMGRAPNPSKAEAPPRMATGIPIERMGRAPNPSKAEAPPRMATGIPIERMGRAPRHSFGLAYDRQEPIYTDSLGQKWSLSQMSSLNVKDMPQRQQALRLSNELAKISVGNVSSQRIHFNRYAQDILRLREYPRLRPIGEEEFINPDTVPIITEQNSYFIDAGIERVYTDKLSEYLKQPNASGRVTSIDSGLEAAYPLYNKMLSIYSKISSQTPSFPVKSAALVIEDFNKQNELKNKMQNQYKENNISNIRLQQSAGENPQEDLFIGFFDRNPVSRGNKRISFGSYI